MKIWNKPEAIGQEFAANEYVSACTVTVDCNVTSMLTSDWQCLLRLLKSSGEANIGAARHP